MTPERGIIGQTEQAGLPISAPLATPDHDFSDHRVRWIMRENSFSLQQWVFGKWVDVPIVREKGETK